MEPSEPYQSCDWACLSTELLVEVCKFLPPSSVAIVRQVCCAWRVGASQAVAAVSLGLPGGCRAHAPYALLPCGTAAAANSLWPATGNPDIGFSPAPTAYARTHLATVDRGAAPANSSHFHSTTIREPRARVDADESAAPQGSGRLVGHARAHGSAVQQHQCSHPHHSGHDTAGYSTWHAAGAASGVQLVASTSQHDMSLYPAAHAAAAVQQSLHCPASPAHSQPAAAAAAGPALPAVMQSVEEDAAPDAPYQMCFGGLLHVGPQAPPQALSPSRPWSCREAAARVHHAFPCASRLLISVWPGGHHGPWGPGSGRSVGAVYGYGSAGTMGSGMVAAAAEEYARDLRDSLHLLCGPHVMALTLLGDVPLHLLCTSLPLSSLAAGGSAAAGLGTSVLAAAPHLHYLHVGGIAEEALEGAEAGEDDEDEAAGSGANAQAVPHMERHGAGAGVTEQQGEAGGEGGLLMEAMTQEGDGVCPMDLDTSHPSSAPTLTAEGKVRGSRLHAPASGSGGDDTRGNSGSHHNQLQIAANARQPPPTWDGSELGGTRTSDPSQQKQGSSHETGSGSGGSGPLAAGSAKPASHAGSMPQLPSRVAREGAGSGSEPCAPDHCGSAGRPDSCSEGTGHLVSGGSGGSGHGPSSAHASALADACVCHGQHGSGSDGSGNHAAHAGHEQAAAAAHAAASEAAAQQGAPALAGQQAGQAGSQAAGADGSSVQTCAPPSTGAGDHRSRPGSSSMRAPSSECCKSGSHEHEGAGSGGQQGSGSGGAKGCAPPCKRKGSCSSRDGDGSDNNKESNASDDKGSGASGNEAPRPAGLGRRGTVSGQRSRDGSAHYHGDSGQYDQGSGGSDDGVRPQAAPTPAARMSAAGMQPAGASARPAPAGLAAKKPGVKAARHAWQVPTKPFQPPQQQPAGTLAPPQQLAQGLLPGLANLRELRLWDCRGLPTPDTLGALSSLPHLSLLDIRPLRGLQADAGEVAAGRRVVCIGDDHLARIAALTGLTGLHLSHVTRVTGTGLAHLHRLTGMQALSLTSALDAHAVSGDHLQALSAAMPHLHSLHLGCLASAHPMPGMGLGLGAPPALDAATTLLMPHVLPPGAMDADGLLPGHSGSLQPWSSSLMAFASLTTLGLQVVSSLELQLLSSLRLLDQLKVLDLEAVDLPFGEIMVLLEGACELRALRRLALCEVVLYDAHLAALGALTQLRGLTLAQVDVRTRDLCGWTSLAPLSNLRSFEFQEWNNPVLSVGNLVALTDDSCAMMAASWRLLEQLRYAGKVVLTAAAREALSRLGHLSHLLITGTDGTQCIGSRAAAAGAADGRGGSGGPGHGSGNNAHFTQQQGSGPVPVMVKRFSEPATAAADATANTAPGAPRPSRWGQADAAVRYLGPEGMWLEPDAGDAGRAAVPPRRAGAGAGAAAAMEAETCTAVEAAPVHSQLRQGGAGGPGGRAAHTVAAGTMDTDARAGWSSGGAHAHAPSMSFMDRKGAAQPACAAPTDTISGDPSDEMQARGSSPAPHPAVRMRPAAALQSASAAQPGAPASTHAQQQVPSVPQAQPSQVMPSGRDGLSTYAPPAQPAEALGSGAAAEPCQAHPHYANDGGSSPAPARAGTPPHGHRAWPRAGPGRAGGHRGGGGGAGGGLQVCLLLPHTKLSSCNGYLTHSGTPSLNGSQGSEESVNWGGPGDDRGVDEGEVQGNEHPAGHGGEEGAVPAPEHVHGVRPHGHTGVRHAGHEHVGAAAGGQ